MKKINGFSLGMLLMAILAVMILALPQEAEAAASVIKTPNGEVVPYVGSSWEMLTAACSADTVWTEVTIPDNTYEMEILPSAGIKVAADSVYSVANKREIALADTTLWLRIPTTNMTTFWIRRASAGTAANLYIIYKKW